MESINNVNNLVKSNVYMTSIDLKMRFSQNLFPMIIKSILNLCLEICFNLHPYLMAMDFYFLFTKIIKVTTELHTKLIHIPKEMHIALALLTF